MTDMDQMAQANGWPDWAAMSREVAAVDLTAFDAMVKFRVWSDTDGTRAGLIALGLLPQGTDNGRAE